MSEELIPYFGPNGRVTNIDRENENFRLDKVVYQDLNARQKESYNFQKLSSVLADYGYTTYRMFDDYNGADLHAVRISGEVVKIQLKGRLTVDRKYLNKQLYIAFSDNGNWYCYPHDYIFLIITNHSDGAKQSGVRSIGHIPEWLKELLSEFKIS